MWLGETVLTILPCLFVADIFAKMLQSSSSSVQKLFFVDRVFNLVKCGLSWVSAEASK